VAGNPLRGPPATTDFFHHGQSDIVWSQSSETPLLGGSQVGNDRFLHGRPYISSLGLYDHRARFYEPGTQLFLEPDPLGPVDSPNLYQAFGFDGLNVVDPFGAQEIVEKSQAARVVRNQRIRKRLDKRAEEAEKYTSFGWILKEAYGRPIARFFARVSDTEEEIVQAAGDAGVAAVEYAIPTADVDPERERIARGVGQGGVTGGANLRNNLQGTTSEIAERGMEGGTRFAIEVGEDYALGVGLGATIKAVSGRFVRRSLPALPTRFLDEFEGPVRTRTFKAGERVYRSPWIPDEAVENPGSWFGTRRTATRAGTDSMYQIEKFSNPNEVIRTYEFTEDVTVYYGQVKGGTGYQALIPSDVTPGDVLRFVDEAPLR
jgi:RHS repeat-associated protein